MWIERDTDRTSVTDLSARTSASVMLIKNAENPMLALRICCRNIRHFKAIGSQAINDVSRRLSLLLPSFDMVTHN